MDNTTLYQTYISTAFSIMVARNCSVQYGQYIAPFGWDSVTPEYINIVGRAIDLEIFDGIWVSGDPYKESKPFRILWIGIKNGYLDVEVTGQKTARIESNWSKRLSAYLGAPVNLFWREDSD